jgi:hypothetical protein
MQKQSSQFILLILIFSLQFSSLCAQNEIPDSLITERLRFIKNTFEHDKVNTQRWWYGWLAAYGSATIVQGAIYPVSHDKSMQQDLALGAATSLLGVAGQFISPLIPRNNPEQMILMPETSGTERLKKLAMAEELLKECAMREKLARSWKSHAICSAVNLGGGLITWLSFKRTVWNGIGYFALNTVITETQIWTQPTLARRNYRKYHQKYLENEDGISYLPDVNWYLEAYPGGLGIKVKF